MNSRRKSHILGLVASMCLAQFSAPIRDSRHERRALKIKFGSIIVDGSGKIGGHVVSSNRGGKYMRTKSTPINPQSVDQNAIRSRLSSLSTGWGGLTEDQRNAWNGAVGLFSKTNIFGDKTKPSGINLYVKLNANLLILGEAQIDVPPLPVAIPAIENLSFIATTGANTIALTFAPTPVPAGFSMLIEATAGYSAGKSNVKNKFRVIDFLPAATATGYALGVKYVAKFGDLAAAGSKISVRAYLVSTDTGQKGLPYSAMSIIV